MPSEKLLETTISIVLVIAVISPLLYMIRNQMKQANEAQIRVIALHENTIKSQDSLTDALKDLQGSLNKASDAQINTANKLESVELRLAEMNKKIERLPGEVRAEVVKTFDTYLDTLTETLKRNSLIPQSFNVNGHRRGGFIERIFGGGY